MHLDKKVVLENIEIAREIAKDQFGEESPELVLKVAELIAAEQQRQELREIADGVSYRLEIETIY
jgi:CRISPR/Cas system-associated protein Csm6